MAWFKVTVDRLSRRLDDPNDRNTYPEYEYHNKGDVFEMDADSPEARRRLKRGSVVVASDEEAEAGVKAAEDKEKADIDAAQAQLKAQQEYLAGLEADRQGAPGERQFQPDLAEARAKLAAGESGESKPAAPQGAKKAAAAPKSE